MILELRKSELLAAALPHVVFDGWSQACFEKAIEDLGMDRSIALAIAPGGAVDLAVAFHEAGDQKMRRDYANAITDGMKVRAKVKLAVRLRLEAGADKEIVRRGSSLFALPNHAAQGAKLIWGTADEIWNALGDTSDDVNWYTKRVILSAVYASTVLFWLGDDSLNSESTWEFLDRRIENVMQIEVFKSRIKANEPLNAMMSGPLRILEKLKRPVVRGDLPGGAPKPRV
tara:strand:- start:108 stop:794 length:687 start_codon:yes stop_codon:yes gene_type:complete